MAECAAKPCSHFLPIPVQETEEAHPIVRKMAKAGNKGGFQGDAEGKELEYHTAHLRHQQVTAVNNHLVPHKCVPKRAKNHHHNELLP